MNASPPGGSQFEKLDQGICIPFDLSLVASIPEVVHEYGAAYFPRIPDELCWLTYAERRGEEQIPGGISFSRNTEHYLPDFVASVMDYLQSRFPLWPWLSERVHLIRTYGAIAPHIDEVRKCALNIGLHNSNSAETFFSLSNRETDFIDNAADLESYVMQDGDVWLLDVSKFHSVRPKLNTPNPRYLVTYGFSASYNRAIHNLRKSQVSK
jgi:hypothetical protein